MMHNDLNFGLRIFDIGVCTLLISVRFFTSLREIVGKKEEALEFPDNETVTVNKVLKRLKRHYGKEFAEYVYDPRSGNVKSFLQFLINGQSASTLKGLDTELSDGDVLAIIPPVGGG
jgi:MoaD family protein